MRTVRRNPAAAQDELEGSELLKERIRTALQKALFFSIWFLIPGLMGGAVYSFPVVEVTREREPWLSLLLGACLGVTVFGIGLCLHTPPVYLTGAWLLSVLALVVVRVAIGKLNNGERFALPHILSLLFTLLACYLARLA